MKKVSIITRTKNRPLLLKRAYQSINTQTYKNFEWIIINDGGRPEDVEDLFTNSSPKLLQYTIIHNAISAGMEAASNKAIKNSTGDYIIIHDDDDSWAPTFLEETVGFLESEYGIYFGGVVTRSYKIIENLDENSCVFVKRTVYNGRLSHVYLSDMAKANLFPPISFLYRKEIYDLAGGYDEALPVLGDWDFNLRFLLHADIAVIEKTLANYHHRMKTANASYGNTVVQDVDKHKLFDTIIRNKLLRQDIRNNTFGLGFLVNIEKDMRQIIDSHLGPKIKEVLKNEGILGLIMRR